MIDTKIDLKDDKMIKLRTFMEELKSKEHPGSYLIAILHKAQELYGYLDRSVMDEIALTMNIPTSHIWGVATFYHYFTLKPRGKHLVSVCLGTACYIKGADKILNAIKEDLQINVGGTSKDRLFTFQEARCLGACGLAPVVMVDDKIYGNVTPKSVLKILKSYRK
ncbi:MAG TPA: NADH-quinone oxidoreductase subunit NuoE [Candidatus Eremiobacteraeota bacterium]|nr:MAG: NADP-reducing hydrogenase subunit HndA [bacterium ADurb.Bin363]HPZ07505.1 NADH-quinone oxidoreductase subunit NuoE [Candidatus Eremiobacteraeota bacterium]